MNKLLKCWKCKTLITPAELERAREITENDDVLCRACAAEAADRQSDVLEEVEDGGRMEDGP